MYVMRTVVRQPTPPEHRGHSNRIKNLVDCSKPAILNGTRARVCVHCAVTAGGGGPPDDHQDPLDGGDELDAESVDYAAPDDAVSTTGGGFCGVYDRCGSDISFGSLANGTGEVSDSITLPARPPGRPALC